MVNCWTLTIERSRAWTSWNCESLCNRTRCWTNDRSHSSSNMSRSHQSLSNSTPVLWQLRGEEHATRTQSQSIESGRHKTSWAAVPACEVALFLHAAIRISSRPWTASCPTLVNPSWTCCWSSADQMRRLYGRSKLAWHQQWSQVG